MRSALIVGVSIFALSLGGCTWLEQKTGIGNGSQSNAQAQPTPATSMSGTSQAQTPVPNGGPGTTAAQAQSGSTTAHTPARHHLTASNEVRQAQQKLAAAGDYKGKVDGLEGPLTHQALVAFQQKNQLKQTGRLDKATREKLGMAGTAASGSSMPAPAQGGSATTAPSGDNGGAGMPPAGTSGSAIGGGNASPNPTGTMSQPSGTQQQH
jgi:peptidoglycan hydrolase-like protein with peptidoglycan-binding domain